MHPLIPPLKQARIIPVVRASTDHVPGAPDTTGAISMMVRSAPAVVDFTQAMRAPSTTGLMTSPVGGATSGEVQPFTVSVVVTGMIGVTLGRAGAPMVSSSTLRGIST